MTEHVSIWDDPSEQQQTDSTDTSTSSVSTATATASDATSSSEEMNPIEAAVAASSWSRADLELALQVANLLVLVYFTVKWRQQHV